MPNYTGNWGLTCLATLYKTLCAVAKYGVKDMPEYTLLLKTWVWSRMLCVALMPKNHPQGEQQASLTNI